MTDETAPTLEVHYEKTNSFREISCDGALGGPTPQGKFWIAFYSERLPLPHTVRHTLKPTGVAGEFQLDPSVEVVEGKQGIIRNLEFAAYMSREVAIQLRDWLEKNLRQLHSNQEITDEPV